MVRFEWSDLDHTDPKRAIASGASEHVKWQFAFGDAVHRFQFVQESWVAYRFSLKETAFVLPPNHLFNF